MSDEESTKESTDKWNLEITSFVAEQSESSQEDLIAALAKKVERLMDQDYKKFLNDLYRLDVSEEKTRHVLNTKKGEDKFKALAELILKRELQKFKTQQQYLHKKIESGEE